MHQWRPHQTERRTSLKSITKVIQIFWLVVTNATIVKSLEAVLFRRGAIATIDWLYSWCDPGKTREHQWGISRGKWGSDMEIIISSNVPACPLPWSSVSHQRLTSTSPLCVCMCVYAASVCERTYLNMLVLLLLVNRKSNKQQNKLVN